MLGLVLAALGGVIVFWYLLVPLFERFAPVEVVRAYQRFTMPFFRVLCGIAPGFGVVETVGRRSGKPRRVPVGGRLDGDAFWIVAGEGRRAHYVCNIKANPHVRVKFLGSWRSGTAYLCPDDDARRRAIEVSLMNGLFLRLANRSMLTIRVELDR